MSKKNKRVKKNKKNINKTINIAKKDEEIIKSYYDDIDEYDLEEEIIIEEDEEETIIEEEEAVEPPVLTKVIEEYESSEDFNEAHTKRMQEESEEDIEDDEEYVFNNRKSTSILKKVFAFIIVLIIAMIIMILIDFIAVTKLEKGPYFAYPVNVLDDGGTVEYYGLGYKVIEYNQIQGRRDKELGSWSLKYNSEPITFKDLDMAIEFYGSEDEQFKDYNKKFVRIISTLESVDVSKNKIKIGYKDDGGKYTFNIICKMADEVENIDKFKKNKEITIIGTLSDMKKKTKNNPTTIYISNCFAEQ